MGRKKKGLEVGFKYDNLKAMCNVLKLKYKNGSSSRNATLKRIESEYKLERIGNSYTVLERYDTPKEIPDKRKETKGNFTGKRKIFTNLLIEKENENKIGVYKIVLDNNIYIGSTIQGFRKRFIGHNNKINNKVPFTSEMLDNGATFEVIEFCDGLTELEIRNIENKYIKQYRENDDWNLINSNDAWSYSKKQKQKQKYKTIKIKVKEEDYEETLEFLKDNNLISK